MRRKSDMWQDQGGLDFLPGEGEQAARTAVADVQDRLTTLEDQLKSQFTTMSAYHQIALQTAAVARAEARADLDREKATLVSLVERVRDECSGEAVRVTPIADVMPGRATEPSAETAVDSGMLARIELLEGQLEQFGRQVALCLRSQEELANSIAFMFEQQMRNAGFVNSCVQPAA